MKQLSPSRTFLILTISNLARSCTLVNSKDKDFKSIFALGNLNFIPLKEEIELMQTYKNIKWWNRDLCKLAKNSVSLMFAHMATDNKEFSHDYISHLMQLISQENSICIRHFERPLLRIVQVNDKLQSERVKRVL